MKEPKEDKHSSKKKHKKEKHRKKKKQKRKERSSSPSSNGSDSDGMQCAGSALSQLERERAAVQAARYILATQPGVRRSFRELLWELDNGRAVGLAGVPDAVLAAQLQYTLELLGLKVTKGQYWLPSGAPSTLSVIGFVFEEAVKPAAAPPHGMMPTPAAAAAAATAATKVEPAVIAAAPAEAAAERVVKGPQLPGVAQEQQQQQQKEVSGVSGEGVGPAEPPDGPSGPAAASCDNNRGAEQQRQQQQQQHQHQQQEDEAGQQDQLPAEPARQRRIVGPAAPPAELLAAAAAYHANVEAAGGYGPAADAEPLVGPPPPDFVDEADAAPADAREAQVLRVLRVLKEAAAAAAGNSSAAAAAAAAGPAMDPYAVLGVDKDADAGTIRKSYWRLSLLVHPDKCSHPAAQEVFQAVSKAAQLLQDAQQRAQHDAAQAEAALRQQALAAAAAAEREVAWKRARGEVVPQELAAALAEARNAGPAVRDSWMTDLPTQQQLTAASVLAAGLSQTSQTSFNRFGTRQPGDTSGWTDTPQQREARAAGLLPAAGPSVPALTGAGASTAAGEGAPVSAELLAAMAKYNESHRQKSLLEQHAEQGKSKPSKGAEKTKDKQGREKDSKPSKHKGKEANTESKGQKRKAGDAEQPEWAGKHPWQPFDRDKDMSVQLQKPKAAGDLLKAAGALSSRFSSAGQ